MRKLDEKWVFRQLYLNSVPSWDAHPAPEKGRNEESLEKKKTYFLSVAPSNVKSSSVVQGEFPFCLQMQPGGDTYLHLR